MHIQLTKKMIDWLEPNLIEKDTDNDLYAWHAHYQVANRKKFIVLTNDLTRFCLVIYGMTKKDFKEPEFIIFNALLHALMIQGYDLELIDKYMRHLNKITFGKTKNRTLVARLNSASFYAIEIAYNTGIVFDNFEQNHISKNLNEIFVSESKGKVYYIPKNRMLDYLKLL